MNKMNIQLQFLQGKHISICMYLLLHKFNLSIVFKCNKSIQLIYSFLFHAINTPCNYLIAVKMPEKILIFPLYKTASKSELIFCEDLSQDRESKYLPLPNSYILFEYLLPYILNICIIYMFSNLVLHYSLIKYKAYTY